MVTIDLNVFVLTWLCIIYYSVLWWYIWINTVSIFHLLPRSSFGAYIALVTNDFEGSLTMPSSDKNTERKQEG